MLYLSVFDYKAYVFFPSKVHANKLVPHSKLMIFIEYKDNGYYCHIPNSKICLKHVQL